MPLSCFEFLCDYIYACVCMCMQIAKDTFGNARLVLYLLVYQLFAVMYHTSLATKLWFLVLLCFSYFKYTEPD
jgi:hypothetical protein